MPISIFINILISFIVTYITIPQIIHVVKEKNLFDEPNHRKLNKVVIPTLGGIGIFIGFTISSIIFLQKQSLPEIRILYAATVIMLFLGLKDDIIAIPARKKLLIQMGVALMLIVLGNFRITNLYQLFAIGEMYSWVSYPLSFLIFLFLINAINLIDGIDGLAAGLSLLISGLLGFWFLMAGHLNYAILCGALAGSLIAFLRFNIWGGKNKIFMGDTGSLILGVIISAMVMKFMDFNLTSTANLHFSQAPLIVLALLIVPITDTLRVFVVRISKKQSPFTPDMNHIHHVLIKLGMSHLQATSFLLLYTMTFLLFAISLQSYLPLTFNFVILLGMSFSSVGLLDRRNKIISRTRRARMIIIKNQLKQDQVIIHDVKFGIEDTLKKVANTTRRAYKN